MEQNTLICDAQFDKQIIIQCSCLGHCSYITLFDLGMNFFSPDDSDYGKRYCFNLNLPVSRRKQKQFEKFANEFLLTAENLKSLYFTMMNPITNDTSQDRNILGFFSLGNYSVIANLYASINIEDSVCQLCFYNTQHKKKNNKTFFDICMTPAMWKKFCDTLKQWIGD